MRLLSIVVITLSSIISFGQTKDVLSKKTVSLVVLGTVQDAGSPHAACKKKCCSSLFENPDNERMVVSLGIVDPLDGANFLIEATPDLPRQMKMLKTYSEFADKETPNGIFLTHAHIGHYAGLMYLGKESMNADKVSVFAMPKMKKFLEKNGPWNQLVETNNIVLYELEGGEAQNYTENLKITPFLVPHRDEYSETVGYKIAGPQKSAVFIPDIDKWEKWDTDIVAYLSDIDYAFLDATFYDGKEVNNRDISEIPHPFVIESMNLFKDLSPEDKAKIHFIHLNHTNPLLNKNSEEYSNVLEQGFNIAELNQVFEL